MRQYAADRQHRTGFVARSGRRKWGKDAEGHQSINRITYEICVLEALCDKLRCKEVWVVGPNRYRNPDKDLPAGFEARRTLIMRR